MHFYQSMSNNFLADKDSHSRVSLFAMFLAIDRYIDFYQIKSIVNLLKMGKYLCEYIVGLFYHVRCFYQLALLNP